MGSVGFQFEAVLGAEIVSYYCSRTDFPGKQYIHSVSVFKLIKCKNKKRTIGSHLAFKTQSLQKCCWKTDLHASEPKYSRKTRVWDKEENWLQCFARQRSLQQAMAIKNCKPTGRKGLRGRGWGVLQVNIGSSWFLQELCRCCQSPQSFSEWYQVTETKG